MLTHGEDVEAHALHERGWTISAIVRHLDGTERPSGPIVRNQHPEVRARSDPDPLEPFIRYLDKRGSIATLTSGLLPSMTMSTASAISAAIRASSARSATLGVDRTVKHVKAWREGRDRDRPSHSTMKSNGTGSRLSLIFILTA